MQAGPLHEALAPLCWLIGRWSSISAKGQYPTIKPYSYYEIVDFESLGQPLLNYKSVAWHPEKKTPMHLESGFLRIKPGSNRLAFMLGHNLGVTSVEEGTVTDYCISLKSTSVGRMSFVRDPPVLAIARSYFYDPDSHQLQMVVLMETCNTPLCEHLRVTYQKSC